MVGFVEQHICSKNLTIFELILNKINMYEILNHEAIHEVKQQSSEQF